VIEKTCPFIRTVPGGEAAFKGETMEDRSTLNLNLAQMLNGGVIMDVTTPDQAKIAQDAGGCAVMALERIPADFRGQVA
jgi:pyridoxal biosynthesis lyase PdxS